MAEDLPLGTVTLGVFGVPPRFSVEMLLDRWVPDGSYDFLHLPFNIRHRRMSRFAVLNFVSADAASSFQRQWEGARLDPYEEPAPAGTRRERNQVLRVASAKLQGLEANLRYSRRQGIERVRNDRHLPRLYKVLNGQVVQLDFRAVMAALPVLPDEYEDVPAEIFDADDGLQSSSARFH